MLLAVIAIVLAIVYVGINLINVALHNYRAHNFFKTKSPKLPVVPGPNLFIGNVLQTTYSDKNYLTFDALHGKYGKSFGFYMCSQPWVATKDLDLIKKIEIDDAYKHLDRTILGMPVREFANSIFQLNGDEWRQVRRAIAPTMTNLKVRGDEVSSGIEQMVGQLVEALEYKMDKAEEATKKRSIIIDAHDTAQRLALSVIFLVMYKQDNIIDFKAEHDSWTDQFEESSKLILNPLTLLSLSLEFLRPIASWLLQFHTVGQMNLRIVDYINQAADLHRVAREKFEKMQRRMSIETGAKERPFGQLKSQPGFKRRMIDGIIDALVEKKITHEQFIGSAHFLLLAGFETTAGTITCLLWQLAKNPDIEEKLRKTVTEQGIDGDYVVWCIMETVRWHPAVILGAGRIISEDITTTDGTLIPKGSFVMPTAYSIHRDETIWPDADKFMPERWKYASSFHPAAFMGFGLGPRNCVGGKMAIHEIKLVLKALLTNYRIEGCEETVDEYKFSSPGLLYTIPDQPIKIRLTAL